MGTLFAGLIVAVLVFFSARYLINDAKKGGSCAGCSGGCSSGHCETAEKFKELHKKRELEQLRSKKL
ncbi:MAG: FeoB-associated Cys-rich membrane protein [Butyrivibrio sp.]|nr:FeoB-associated Cys-rich membrane protein [Butyrivibrio sp.]MCR4834421.1 FeoB-associated Cys-rich membrane protein [Butyrivibrio sp.]